MNPSKSKPIDLTGWGEDSQSRFDSKVRLIPLTGCMVWIGSTSSAGYGQVHAQGRSLSAHRLAYALEYGDTECDLDHVCRVRSCVNPEHLEPVTHRENVLRGASFSASNAGKQFCPRGHEFSDGNMVASQSSRGWRSCLTCLHERHSLIRQAHQALGLTQRQYRDTFGSSESVAREILQQLSGVA